MTKRPPETVAVHDPYAGNSLIAQLGPIRSRPDALKALVEFPARPPKDIWSIPRHVRLHMLMSVRDLHVPSLDELQLYETMDMMIRQNYNHLHPSGDFALAECKSAKRGKCHWKRSTPLALRAD